MTSVPLRRAISVRARIPAPSALWQPDADRSRPCRCPRGQGACPGVAGADQIPRKCRPPRKKPMSLMPTRVGVGTRKNPKSLRRSLGLGEPGFSDDGSGGALMSSQPVSELPVRITVSLWALPKPEENRGRWGVAGVVGHEGGRLSSARSRGAVEPRSLELNVVGHSEVSSVVHRAFPRKQPSRNGRRARSGLDGGTSGPRPRTSKLTLPKGIKTMSGEAS